MREKEKQTGARLISTIAGMRGGGHFRRAGSWPLAFRHWPTRLNNRRYVIAVRVCRWPGGKGGKSANEKQRRSKKVARDECREAGGDYGGRSPTYGSQWHLMMREDAHFSLSLFLFLRFSFLRAKLRADSPNSRQCLPRGGRARERSGGRFRRVTWLNSTSEYPGTSDIRFRRDLEFWRFRNVNIGEITRKDSRSKRCPSKTFKTLRHI